MRTFEEVFENLMTGYDKTGMIGRTKPHGINHARRIAYMAANNIIKREIQKEKEKEIQLKIF